MSIVATVALVFGFAFATADDVAQSGVKKNATAAGQYFYGSFDHNIYNYGRYRNPLINTHVCSVDASYAFYSHERHRREIYRRPFIKECSDVFTGVFDRKRFNNGYSSISCDRCCKIAAHLDRITVPEVVGMVLVLNEKAKCVCCAPLRSQQTMRPYYSTHPSSYPPYYQQPYQPTSF
ncbi:hypothetical protein KIN20_016959 [Parelaphostrongylus tenuis]|uniref:Uncharacterized protein n=1 Tax=Parelaphostrongylus tenuis TaxID=148309 RepID=A0AAD5MH92_PARTN|nr:hypothetical protein KIN20_016959 [Parelaphostrongylus tenuis]